MKLLRAVACALIAVLVAAGSGYAQGSEEHGHGHGHEVKSTLEMDNGEFFAPQFSHHMTPVPVGMHFGDEFEPELTTFYNVNLFQVYVVIAILILFFLVKSSFGGSGQTNIVIRVFRGWCHWLRDEVVVNVMGEKEGQKWAPLFIYIFFFIAFANLVGLVPGSVTSTACVFVTAALAMITFFVMVVGGMIQQGPFAFWKNLLPHGLPVALIPLMAIVEVVGLFVKPIALMIRLFANILAGHLLIMSFVGLIFVFAKMFELGATSWLTALPVVGMAVFINIIEALVVLLQAYIFTYLSVLFVQQALHPEH